MAMDLTALKLRIYSATGLDSTGDDTLVTALLNESGREVWNAHPWPERFAEAFITTVAPYTTGTIAVAAGGTTVTGSGTTFPAHSANTRRFALAYGSPSYLVASRDGATQLTLARAYAETAETAATYVLYSDIYDLAATVDTIEAEGVRLHTADPNGILKFVSPQEMEANDYMGRVAGKPTHWSLVADQTTGTRRIRLWPIPDAAYPINYRYRVAWTDLSAGGDTPVLVEARRDLIWKHALIAAATFDNKPAMAAWARNEYEIGLRRAIVNEKAVDPVVMRFRRFDRVAPDASTLYLSTQDS